MKHERLSFRYVTIIMRRGALAIECFYGQFNEIGRPQNVIDAAGSDSYGMLVTAIPYFHCRTNSSPLGRVRSVLLLFCRTRKLFVVVVELVSFWGVSCGHHVFVLHLFQNRRSTTSINTPEFSHVTNVRILFCCWCWICSSICQKFLSCKDFWLNILLSTPTELF